MTRSKHDEHFVGKWVAQCARNERFTTNVSFDVPVVQPNTRSMSGGNGNQAEGASGNTVRHVPALTLTAPTQGESAEYLALLTPIAVPPRVFVDGSKDRDRSAAIPYEREVLASCLIALRLHPKVAWIERMNSGKFQLPGKDGKPQWVRFGFKGMADITGQLKDGRRLEVECKRPGEKPTDDQAAFLANVIVAGGVAFVAWSIDDVIRELADPKEAA